MLLAVVFSDWLAVSTWTLVPMDSAGIRAMNLLLAVMAVEHFLAIGP